MNSVVATRLVNSHAACALNEDIAARRSTATSAALLPTAARANSQVKTIPAVHEELGDVDGQVWTTPCVVRALREIVEGREEGRVARRYDSVRLALAVVAVDACAQPLLGHRLIVDGVVVRHADGQALLDREPAEAQVEGDSHHEQPGEASFATASRLRCLRCLERHAACPPV
jgi:hypothetical protein